MGNGQAVLAMRSLKGVCATNYPEMCPREALAVHDSSICTSKQEQSIFVCDNEYFQSNTAELAPSPNEQQTPYLCSKVAAELKSHTC